MPVQLLKRSLRRLPHIFILFGIVPSTYLYILSKEMISSPLKMISLNLSQQQERSALPVTERTVPPVHTSGNDTGESMVFYVPGIGRLGNRLFQYAAVYGITKRLHRTPAIVARDELPKIFQGIQARVIIKHENTSTYWEEQSMIFTPKLFELPRGDLMSVCCYFQSWKYFEGYENEIRQQFAFRQYLRDGAEKTLTTMKKQYLQTKYSKSIGYLDQNPSHMTFVGIHVRRGDMSSALSKRRGYIPAPEGYIRNAMGYFRRRFNDSIFVLSSDDHRWCEQTFREELANQNLFMTSGATQFEDLATLASCNHTIMTVGSFGWWAAWLAGGEVTYFSGWPAPGSETAARCNKQDYFPPHWMPME